MSRACLLWSATYDGVSPPPQGVEEEDQEEGERREKRERDGESESRRRAQTPPSTPSSLCSDSVARYDDRRPGRSGSAAEEELEWDDMAVDEEENAPQQAAAPAACLQTPPPRHIQAMRRSAALLVSGGAYSEETDFLSDLASTCDLVSTRDLLLSGGDEAALAAASTADHAAPQGSGCRGDGSSGQSTPTRKTVLEAISSIMSSRRREARTEERRRGQEGVREETRRGDEGKREEEDNLHSRMNGHADAADTRETHAQSQHTRQHYTHTQRTANSHAECETCDTSVILTNGVDSLTTARDDDSFLSQYRTLMMSLGAEPEDDDMADGMAVFRRRVQALLEKQEEEGLEQEVDFDGWEQAEERGGEDGEESRRERKAGVPFTGWLLL